MRAMQIGTFATILMLAGLSPGVATAAEFESSNVHLEYSATDDDGEAVIDLKAGFALKQLELFSPERKCESKGENKRENKTKPRECKRQRIVNLTSEHIKGLGLSHISLETNEPAFEDVTAAYPEGTYTFRGVTKNDEIVEEDVVVSHSILSAPVISAPVAGADDVPAEGAVATWEAVPGATAYRVELEQEDLAIILKADILAENASFAFPSGWLTPGLPYVLGVSATGANGNVVVSEISFTTAP